ncbi:MAG: ArsR family transcriptional regulator [Methanomassiliicoccales archaeon]|jgi:predicted transcriptional regulator
MADRGFSKKDEASVELLMGTGMPKNVAKTLAFLRKKEETTSIEVEASTGLRQPEVSIAVQELRRRKWIIKRDLKKEGKGRPVHVYKLSLLFEKIVETLEKEERKRIERIEGNIEQLKTIAH